MRPDISTLEAGRFVNFYVADAISLKVDYNFLRRSHNGVLNFVVLTNITFFVL